MNFSIKVILSFVLCLQTSFAKEQVLVYKRGDFKDFLSYVSSRPTYEELGVVLAFNRMDPTTLETWNRILKTRGISKKAQVPLVEFKLNQIRIEGLKKPITMANDYKLSLSYGGEKISFSDPKNLEKTVLDLEKYFANKGYSSNANDLDFVVFRKLILGDNAEAGIIFPLILGVLVLAALGMADISSSFGKAPEDTWRKNWLFGEEGSKNKIEFKCVNGNLSLINGKQSISFGFEQTHLDNDRVSRVTKKKDVLHPVYVLSYEDKNTGKSGQGLFFQDDGEFKVKSGSFLDMNEQKKSALLALSRGILGNDGNQKVCTDNKFASDAWKEFFQKIAEATNKKLNDKSPSAVEELKVNPGLTK